MKIQSRHEVNGDSLRSTEKFIGFVLYLVMGYIGFCLLLFPPERYSSVAWRFAFEILPGGQVAWGISFLVPATVGCVVVAGSERTRLLDVMASGILGLWVFLTGVFFLIAVVDEPAGNPNGPVLYWFISLLFSARAILNLKTKA